MSYVLLFPDGGYAGLDHGSGGYPWNCGYSLNSAKFWDNKEEAIRYAKSFPELRLFSFTYQLSAME